MGTAVTRVLFNWSGGKDSALALYELQQDPTISVAALLTTVNAEHQRISMHGVRRSLLHAQAKAIGLPLVEVLVPDSPDMAAYEHAMRTALEPFIAQGITQSVFGDIFLDDLRAYREQQLQQIGMTGVFPLWKRDTSELAETFIDSGFKTILVCTQADQLDASFAGRLFDRSLLADLPATVDPCGENGEFHTFVFDGPIFHTPVTVEVGETVFRTYGGNKRWGFYYVDLLGKGEE